MKAILQLTRIAFGFFAATVIAPFAVHFLSRLLPWQPEVPYTSFREFLTIASVDWLFFTEALALPALIAILVAEIFKLRSAAFYILAGAAIGLLFTGWLRSISHSLDLSGAPAQGAVEGGIVLFAGALGALAYWRFAGKFSGMWRER
ncbi:MAG: hypothetical protein KF748_09890 [Xanthobacteraceae bacterium]|nr:hypothetical protein [Xanthobacteraceae bacterium]